MGIDQRFNAGRFHAGRFSGNDGGTITPSYQVTVSGLVSNPEYGQTAQIGTPLIATAHGFSDAAPGSIGWQWRNGSGDITGATDASYTPVESDDLQTIYPVAYPADTYAAKPGPAHTVRFAPAVSLGGLSDVTYSENTGTKSVPAATAFSGSGLKYSVETNVSDLTIDEVTGEISIPTNSGPQSDMVTVTASNSGGSATASFLAVVAERAFTVSLSGLTGNIAQVGTPISAEVEWTGVPGAVKRYRWRSNGSVIPDAPSQTYVVDPSIDGTELSCTIISYDHGNRTSPRHPVQFAAPVASGNLSDVSLVTGSGDQVVDASVDFAGSGMNYAVDTVLAGVSIDAATGLLTISTDVAASGSVTVNASNSGGSASSTFAVSVSAATGTDVTFGAMTLAGSGGLPKPAGATGIVDDGGTNLVLSGNEVVPAGSGGVTDGTLTFDDATVWTVRTVAQGYSVKADQAEIEAAAAHAPVSSDRIALVRDGEATGRPVTIAKGFTGRFTIQGNARGAKLPGFSLDNSRNITLRSLTIERLPSGAGDEIVVECPNTVGITVTDCLVQSKAPRFLDFVSKAGYYDPLNTSFNLIGCRGGQEGGADTANNLTVTDNDLRNCRRALRLVFSDGAVIERNTITDFTANPAELQGSNWSFSDNRAYGCWAHGGGNTGATGPNNPHAGAKWRIPVADASGFSVGESITGATSGETATVIAIETASHEGLDWLYTDGPLWAPYTEAGFFSAGEPINGDLSGSSTMTGEAHAVFPFDYGDPHNSLFGTGFGGDNQLFQGNILLRGTARKDAGMADIGLLKQDYEAICSGPKWNDPDRGVPIHDYTNVTIQANFMECSDNSGLAFGNMTDNCKLRYNTVVYSQASGTGRSPNMYFAEIGPGVEAVGNVATVFTSASGGDNSDLDASFFDLGYGNVSARYAGQGGVEAGDLNEYSALFTGPGFADITPDNAEDRFAAKPGGRLLNGPVRAGCFGTGVYDFDTGTASIPSHIKPRTTVATGVRLNQVAFDGSSSFRITESTPFLGITNPDEMTIIMGLTMNSADDGADRYLVFGNGYALTVRRKPDGRISVGVEDAAGNSALSFRTSMRMDSADGPTIWTFSWKLSTYEINVMKGSVIDPFVQVDICTGRGIGTNASYIDCMGGMNGNLEFLLIDDKFLDFDQATVDRIVSLDGKHPSYGPDGSAVMGRRPKIYLTGDRSAWASDALQLGSIAGAAKLTGTVTDFIPDTTAPVLSAAGGTATGQTVISRTVSTNEGDGRLYFVTTTQSAAPSAAQVRLGQDNAGLPAIASGNQPVTASGAQLCPDAEGLAQDTSYWHHFLHEDFAGNQSTVLSSGAIVTNASSYTQVWAQFPADKSAYLERGGELSGAPATTPRCIYAATFSPSAGDLDANGMLLATDTSSSYFAQFVHSSLNYFGMKQENSLNSIAVSGYATQRAETADEKYLLLYSYDDVAGASFAVVNLSGGALLGETYSYNFPGMNLASGSQVNWFIGGNGVGGSRIAGQMERCMLWLGQSLDFSLQANRSKFVEPDGSLLSPSEAVANVAGAGPIINISGTGFVTGKNDGSGGDFTVTGTITV